ncbi:Plug domain-containing protein [Chryseobacterium sp. Alg-005]|uniref:hypothetical protein n=1 Tax=Chryseobacterium sp. Alg-005 TaxID=3159516 RepID=UPI003555B47C
MSKKLIFMVAMGFMSYSHAQNKAEEALQKFEQKYPQEKIHLLFNKSSYVAGENLWFKSFVFDGYNRSTVSSNLFVELYDRNKTQISKAIFPLYNGEGSGSLSLPETLKENVYYIRAYTTWMANFNEDFQLIQPIAVYNPSSNEKLVSDTTSPWTATVFPESGTFIDGINTKFAVRLQSRGITPSDWNGYVIDSENPDVKIASFKGFDRNVGAFSLTPKSGRKYQLIVQDDKGIKQNIDLPIISASGINLQVKSKTNAITYSIKSKNYQHSSYKVLGTINNQLVYKAQIHNLSNEAVYSIPTDKLVNGILQLTVFDDKEQVVAKRLCFVQPESLKINKPSVQYTDVNKNPHEANTFTIAKNPNYSSYSVVVLDGESQDAEEERSLLSTLWLTGDITSKIYTPAQYFAKNHNAEALDALLISEKWKRFDWHTLISGSYPAIKYAPESYLTYKGKVSGQPAGSSELNLISKTDQENGTKLYQIPIDPSSNFIFNDLIFEGTMKFFYQLSGKQKASHPVSVYIQPAYAFIPYKSDLPASGFHLVERPSNDPLPIEVSKAVETKSFYKSLNEKINTIEEIRLKGQRKDDKRKLNQQLSSSLFRSNNEEIFDFVNDNKSLVAGGNILQFLEGRVAGFRLQMQNGSYVPMLRGSITPVFLNEMKIDPSQINSISVADVAMIKVIKDYFPGAGPGGGGQAIAIYTRQGGDIKLSEEELKLLPGLKYITLNGYDKEAVFNNAVYENVSLKNIAKDTRTTLYWNPYLETKANEPTPVKFYNNDDTKSHTLLVIGFDENDTPLYYHETRP